MEKTIVNLSKAFVGESQARNRYTMYAKIAKKEGYEEIAANFESTATQEAEHAKWLMRMINELKDGAPNFSTINLETEVPTIIGDTKENLKAAIAGENHEHTSMYPEFAKVAEEEDISKVAVRLRSIAKAEENHEDRYKKFLNDLEQGLVFKKEISVVWQCRKCGDSETTEESPSLCPSCNHPRAYFEVKK